MSRELARKREPVSLPKVCWRCDAPAVTGHALCGTCLEYFRERGRHFRGNGWRWKR